MQPTPTASSPAPAATTQQPGQTNAKPNAKPNAAAQSILNEQYDLTQIGKDRSDIIIRTQQFVDDVLIEIDRLYRQRPPTTPYLSAANGQATPKQYTHPLITNFVSKGVPFMLSKGVTVHCPPDSNPACSISNLALAEKLIRATWKWNETRVPGRNDDRRRARLIALQGGYACQYSYLDPDDAMQVNDGFPVVSQLHSLIDVQYDRDPLGAIKRVIVSKRRIAGELPDDLRGTHDPSEELDVAEHWDRINHGIVINGSEVVLPLTPHGYVDRLGKPLCPWVICLHDPEEYVKGAADITSTGSTPLKTIVGHPPTEQLIDITHHLSYILTLVRYTTTEAALPPRVIKGDYSYDQARRAYIFSQAGQGDGVEYLNNATSIGPMMQVAEFFHQLSQQGVMADGLFSGTVKEISGTSAQQQTDMVKGVLDEMQRTFERGKAAEGELILDLVASNTQPSTADLYKQRFGKPLPAKNPSDSLNYTNGTPMPLSEIVTGNTYDTITSANLEHIITVEVNVEPYDKLPKEQRWQTGIQLLQSDKSPFDPVEVLGTFLDYDNPQATYERGLLSKMMQNPQLPFADLMALRALVAQKEGDYDPQVTEQWRTAIDQAEQQAVQNTITQKLAAISQGVNVGSSPQQQGAPPGMPPGMPPGQPQPPGGAQAQAPLPGMSNGVPAPVQPPQPPMPQPMPQQPAPTMQGA